MTVHLGDFSPGDTVRHMFSTAGIFGESLDMDDAGQFVVEADDGTTYAHPSNTTLSRDFDGIEGLHLLEVTTDSGSGAMKPGYRYEIIKKSGTLDGESYRIALASFSLEADRNEHVRELPYPRNASPGLVFPFGTDVFIIDETLPQVADAFAGLLLIAANGTDKGIGRRIVASTYVSGEQTELEIESEFPASDFTRAFIIGDAPPEV